MTRPAVLRLEAETKLPGKARPEWRAPPPREVARGSCKTPFSTLPACGGALDRGGSVHPLHKVTFDDPIEAVARDTGENS